jgi:hypothetical protein
MSSPGTTALTKADMQDDHDHGVPAASAGAPTTVRNFSDKKDDHKLSTKVPERIQKMYGTIYLSKKKKHPKKAILVVNPSHIPPGDARAAFVKQVCAMFSACVCVSLSYGHHIFTLI